MRAGNPEHGHAPKPNAQVRRGLSCIRAEMIAVADTKGGEDTAARKDAQDIFAALMWLNTVERNLTP